MELVVDKILLKHSNGIDKEPLPAELDFGELAVNSHNGVMYQKVNNGAGDIISSTKFLNIFNVSPQPTYNVPLTANEGDIVDITINNYNASNSYGVRVTGGSINTASNPFKWTLPAVTDTLTHGITITSQEEGKLESPMNPYKYITVSNVEGITDDAVILNSLNIDTPLFDTLTDVSISQGILIVNGVNVLAETINFEQEVEDADWSSYMTSIQVKHLNMLVGEVTDLNSIAIVDNIPMSIGDNVYVKQEGMIKEVSVGTIEDIAVSHPIKQIAVGGDNWSIFLLEDGTLRFNGESFDAAVEGISDVKYIATGNNHAMAIKEDNSLWVIGENTMGQLGLGDTTNRAVWINSGLFVKSIACVLTSSMIILLDGTIMSTGAGASGRLSLGNSTDVNIWTDTTSIGESVYGHTDCFYLIKDDNSLWGVGENNRGQLGVGNTIDRSRFTATGHNAVDVFPGTGYVLIKKDDNSIFSSGYNNQGQLLLGNSSNSIYELTDTSLKGKQVYCSAETTHIVKLDNTIWTCGANNYNQCGLGHNTDLADIVTQTAFIGGDYKITNHDDHIFIIDPDQRAFATGRNHYGSLNILQTTVNIFTLTQLSKQQSRIIGDFTPPLTDNVSFEEYDIIVENNTYAMTSTTAFKIDENGRLWSRGNNGYGQLGLGDTTNRSTWTDTDITNVKSVFGGYGHAAILKNDGTVWATGYAYHGQLGNGSTVNKEAFTQSNISDVKKIYVTYNATLALKNDGTLWVCGETSQGQLGTGSNANVSSFVRISIDGKVIDVHASASMSMLIKEDGTLFVTGNNTYGQLGLGDTERRYTFTSTGFKAKKISCHYNSAVFIGIDNMVYVAGDNNKRQLLTGNTVDQMAWFNTNIEAIDISMGREFTIIKKMDGTFWGAGENGFGQLGLNHTTDVNILTELSITGKKIIGWDAGTTLITEDDKVMATGRNSHYNISNATGEIYSFVYSDGVSEALVLPNSKFNISTTPGTLTKPQWMYKNTLTIETSLEATSTKSFEADTLMSIPEEIVGGLKYKYNLVTKAGRFISTKISGLLPGEMVSEVRTELEK